MSFLEVLFLSVTKSSSVAKQVPAIVTGKRESEGTQSGEQGEQGRC